MKFKSNSMRKNGPNILILGTPGTGKSMLCQELLKCADLKHLNIAKIIEDKKLFEEWDDDLNCSIYDEDKLVNELESYNFRDGGYLIEFHSCEFFEDGEIDHVIVLRTDIEILGKRLEDRKYSDEKIRENIQCEILRVVLDDALEVFDEDKVVEHKSNTKEDMESIVEAVLKLIEG